MLPPTASSSSASTLTSRGKKIHYDDDDERSLLDRDEEITAVYARPPPTASVSPTVTPASRIPVAFVSPNGDMIHIPKSVYEGTATTKK